MWEGIFFLVFFTKLQCCDITNHAVMILEWHLSLRSRNNTDTAISHGAVRHFEILQKHGDISLLWLGCSSNTFKLCKNNLNCSKFTQVCPSSSLFMWLLCVTLLLLLFLLLSFPACPSESPQLANEGTGPERLPPLSMIDYRDNFNQF